MNLHRLLDKLAAEEDSFAGREILAPVLAGQKIAVKIAGVVCHLAVNDLKFQGWGVLRTQDMDAATIERTATRSEIEKYLALLPAVRLTAIARDDKDSTLWHTLAAQQGDARLKLDKPAPLFLCAENVQNFATILARFDGGRFWFQKLDAKRSPAFASYLREQMHAETPPDRLQKKGLSGEERAAYTWLWREAAKARELTREQRETARLQNALAHANGTLISFIERQGVYTVTYRVGDRRLTSTVRQDDLSVMTSGICLSGRDRDFDLTSLVGVMQEAERKRRFDYED